MIWQPLPLGRSSFCWGTVGKPQVEVHPSPPRTAPPDENPCAEDMTRNKHVEMWKGLSLGKSGGYRIFGFGLLFCVFEISIIKILCPPRSCRLSSQSLPVLGRGVCTGRPARSPSSRRARGSPTLML